MKRIALIFFHFLFSISVFGQKIHFTDSTNKWAFLQICDGPIATNDIGTASFEGSIDTYGHHYLIFGGTYLREDTTSGIVYIRNGPTSDGGIDDSEKVLYNYNLTVGDTIANGTIKSWVIATSSTEINGIQYEVWECEGFYIPVVAATRYDYYIIEGIGCTNGFVFPIYYTRPYPSCSSQLLCFQTNGSFYSLGTPVPAWGMTSTSYFDNSSSCNTLIVNHAYRTNKIAAIIPNPITENSRIAFPCSIASGSVIVVNDIGQVIATMPFQNKEEIVVGDKIKIPGIYYYQVRDDITGDTFSGKFVAQ